MRLDQFLIGVVLFSLFVVAGSFVYYGTAVEYGKTPDMDLFNSSHNDSNTTYAILDEMYDEFAVDAEGRILGEDSTNVGKEDEDAEQGLLRGAFRTIKLIPKTFTFIDNIMRDIANKIGVSGVFYTALKVIFLVSTTFAVLLLIFRIPR